MKLYIINLTKKNKNSAPSQTVATEPIAPKICWSQPPTLGAQNSKFHPNRFAFGGVIAERVKAVLLAHRIFAIFAFGRIMIVWHMLKRVNGLELPANPPVQCAYEQLKLLYH